MPNRRSILVIPQGIVSVPQKMRARSIVSQGQWAKQDGSTTGLVQAINEAVADDANYIKSGLGPVNDVVSFLLDAANAPQAGNCILKVRYQKDTVPGSQQIDLVVKLYNGASVVVTRTYTNIGTLVEDDYTLSGGEVTACGNFDNLKVECTANAS